MTKILWEAGAENLPNDRGYLPETWVACAEVSGYIETFGLDCQIAFDELGNKCVGCKSLDLFTVYIYINMFFIRFAHSSLFLPLDGTGIV